MVARLFCVTREFRNGQVAKFTGGLAGIEQQTEFVGETRAPLKQSLFLDVIGDQVVVLLAPKLAEVAPDAQRCWRRKVSSCRVRCWSCFAAADDSARR